MKAECDLGFIKKALALFRLETGRYPERLEDLVPKYMDGVPLDPWGHPYIYAPPSNSYLLTFTKED